MKRKTTSKWQRRHSMPSLVGTFLMTTHAGSSADPRESNGLTGNRRNTSNCSSRPEIQVLSFGIGPILEPNQNDVLSGRRSRIGAHQGNVQFREMVLQRRNQYLASATTKLEKAHVAAEIVRTIRSMNPPGRFLRQDKNEAWYGIGDRKAIKKAGQALRGDICEIREQSETPIEGKKSDPLLFKHIAPLSHAKAFAVSEPVFANSAFGEPFVHDSKLVTVQSEPCKSFSTSRNGSQKGCISEREAAISCRETPTEEPLPRWYTQATVFGRSFHPCQFDEVSMISNVAVISGECPRAPSRIFTVVDGGGSELSSLTAPDVVDTMKSSSTGDSFHQDSPVHEPGKNATRTTRSLIDDSQSLEPLDQISLNSWTLVSLDLDESECEVFQMIAESPE